MQGTIAAAGSGSKDVENVYNFRRTANVLPLSKTNIETAFQAAIAVPVTNALNVRFVQTLNTVRFIDDALDPPQGVTRAIAGAIAGESQATYDSIVINLKTGVRGRSGRGSKHYGPIGEASTNGDVLIAGAIVLFNLIGAAILAGFTDADGNVWVPEIVIRNSAIPGTSSQLRTNPTTVRANDVISAVLDSTVGTMRRRKVKTVTA